VKYPEFSNSYNTLSTERGPICTDARGKVVFALLQKPIPKAVSLLPHKKMAGP
jgi:hypothetical protein